MKTSIIPDKTKLSWYEWVILALLILAGIGMSGYLFVRNPNLGADGFQYLTVVINWMSGKGYTNIAGSSILVEPGYGFLAYLLNFLTHDIEYAGMLVSLISYLLLIPFVFFTVRTLFGKWAALFSTFLVTFHPYLIDYSYISLTESCFTFFLFISFCAFVKVLFNNDDNKLMSDILLGLSLSSIVLIRPEGWIVVFLVFVLLMGVSIHHFFDDNRKLQKFYNLAIAALTFLIIVIPWLLFLHHISGMWVISPKQLRILPDNPATMINEEVQGSTNEAVTTAGNGEGFDYLSMLYPDRIIKLIPPFFQMQLTMNFVVLVPFLIACSVFLLLVIIKKSGGKYLSCLRFQQRNILKIIPLVIFYLPALAFLARKIYPRYLLPYSIYSIIFFGILTSKLIEKTFDLLHSSNKTVYGMLAVTFCSIMILFAPQVASVARKVGVSNETIQTVLTYQYYWRAPRAAGEWLRENIDLPTELYLATDHRCTIALFQANGKQLPIPGKCYGKPMGKSTWQDMADFFDDGGDYLIFSINGKAPTHPYFSVLWNDPDKAEEFGLEIVKIEPGIYQIYKSDSTK